MVVLSGSDLTQLFKADTTGIPNDSYGSGCLVAGRALPLRRWFLAVNNVWQVRRWSNGGRGAYVDISAASATILELVALKSGSILVQILTALD